MKKMLPILVVVALAVVGFIFYKKWKEKQAFASGKPADLSAAAKAATPKRAGGWRSRVGGFAKGVGGAALKAGAAQASGGLVS